MCNQNSPETAAEQEKAVSSELQIANIRLQMATARSNAEFNASPAGQITRQFEAMQRVAKPYADSTIVPSHYRGNIGNCVIAIDMSYRMNLPVLMVMKELYVVNGSPSWSSKFLVACINQLGRFTNIRYKKRNLGKIGTIKVQKTEWKTAADGKPKKVVSMVDSDEWKDIDNWECIAWSTEKATGEVLESDPVTIEMAIREGWYTKDGSKWVTMPMLMLSYRAAAFWQRVYAPEVSMGFPTREEVEDMAPSADVRDIEFEEVTPAESPAATHAAVTGRTKTSSAVEEAKEKLRSRTSAAGKPSQTAMEMMP